MNKHICKSCTFYKAYYSRYVDNFRRLPIGFCVKHDKQQNCQETCKDYFFNQQREDIEEKKLLSILTAALTSIDTIAKILKEKQEDS